MVGKVYGVGVKGGVERVCNVVYVGGWVLYGLVVGERELMRIGVYVFGNLG